VLGPVGGAPARLDALAGDRRLGRLDREDGRGTRPNTSSVGIRKIFSPLKPTTWPRLNCRDDDAAARAEGQLEAGGFHDQAVDAGQAAGHLVGRRGAMSLRPSARKARQVSVPWFISCPSPSQAMLRPSCP
jgi:hypothetical protein